MNITRHFSPPAWLERAKRSKDPNGWFSSLPKKAISWQQTILAKQSVKLCCTAMNLTGKTITGLGHTTVSVSFRQEKIPRSRILICACRHLYPIRKSTPGAR